MHPDGQHNPASAAEPQRDCYFEADVAVENSSAGPLFLHRVIGACEPARWRIVETNLVRSFGAPRLTGPEWARRRRRGLRLLDLPGGWARAALLVWRSWWFPPVPIGPPARAALTVAHALSYPGVVARARREGRRCVVLVHDHPASSCPGGRRTWRLIRPVVLAALRAAGVCLAAGPAGAAWLRTFGAAQTGILYPVWPDDTPPPRPSRAPRRILAYAGNIADAGYRAGLISASFAATAAGWRLVVYPSALPDDALRRAVAPEVEWRATVPPATLLRFLAEEADAALITTSFAPAQSEWVRVATPSKLADYTYAGVPVIAVVPAGSSLDGLAHAHPELLTVVTTPEPPALADVLRRRDGRSAETTARTRATAARLLGLAPNVAVLRHALALDG